MQNWTENSGTIVGYLPRLMKQLLGNHEQINSPGVCELADTFTKETTEPKCKLNHSSSFISFFNYAFQYITLDVISNTTVSVLSSSQPTLPC